MWVPTDRCTQPQIVGKLVRFTDVDWVTIPARKEKKEKAEFWDAVEGRSEEAMVEDIFCDALDHHFFTTNASTAPRFKGNGSETSWTRRFQGRRRRRKRKAALVKAVKASRH